MPRARWGESGNCTGKRQGSGALVDVDDVLLADQPGRDVPPDCAELTVREPPPPESPPLLLVDAAPDAVDVAGLNPRPTSCPASATTSPRCWRSRPRCWSPPEDCCSPRATMRPRWKKHRSQRRCRRCRTHRMTMWGCHRKKRRNHPGAWDHTPNPPAGQHQHNRRLVRRTCLPFDRSG